MPSPRFEFHIARAARARYRCDAALFSLTGNVVFGDPAASRELAERMNRARDVERHPGRRVGAAALYAMGLVDEALHAMVGLYRRDRDPRALVDALAWFERRLGRDTLDATLLRFGEEFPAVAVHRGERTAAEWLAQETGGVPHRAVALEELMLLWLANLNPAFRPFRELFDDTALAAATAYPAVTGSLRDYFDTRPRFGPENLNLVDLLRAPALASPDSLAGQLAYIRERWGTLIGDMLRRMLTALDVLQEEELAHWLRFHPAAGFAAGGPPPLGPSGREWVPGFAGLDAEYDAFSPDADWMPRTVLLAKSVYVWLHQLSVAYGRGIGRLDEVPDEELDTLARRGFTALWLIGLWQRSRASQRIKQLTGNPDAAASAYSLDDYVVADDLGGPGAFASLRERARVRGIRLASDMVPNHMGVDSRWVIEHPDWFLALPHPPYPGYRFDGPDLSSDGRVEIRIEDHYYDRTDAAVVFRRVDRFTGDTRFIYHGNDGTGLPWNDTAQLDYRKAHVREGVIQTILHVARQFPIIRFDAAMTLAKRHYQRLWFPVPGTGGAIPSRAEHGMTREEFDAVFPQEFWREVVDRVAAEAPGTLLLAEAFWLMEGYFVRTLGMHRVYNSAFMNMLRDEENANYRSVMKNTLEFDPEVLKRYVNFMSNPDERTAVDQFGKGDKYFGVCTLMATLPGLPMFGHGQIEGFTEKYGMEFRRSYHDEPLDAWLVARHEREISPLLHRRALFADVNEFLLYDFFTDAGDVNEDVFAYSNRRGGERALVVYHNRYATTSGWIRTSVAYAERGGEGGARLRQRTLGEAMGLDGDPERLIAFRDARTGLEHLHRGAHLAERGLHLALDAYRCHVFLDWRELRDDGRRPWSALCDALGGRGVPSLEEALRAWELAPLHQALRALLGEDAVEGWRLAAAEGGPHAEAAAPALERRIRTVLEQALRVAHPEAPSWRAVADAAVAARAAEAPGVTPAAEAPRTRTAARDTGPASAPGAEKPAPARTLEARLAAALRLPALLARIEGPLSDDARAVLPVADAPAERSRAAWAAVLAQIVVEALGHAGDPAEPDAAAVRLFDALRLREPLAHGFEALGMSGEERWRAAARVRARFAHGAWGPGAAQTLHRAVASFSWAHDPDVAWTVGVHEHEGVRYLVKEHYERLLWWMALPALLQIAERGDDPAALPALRAVEHEIAVRLAAAERAGWRVEGLFDTGGRTPAAAAPSPVR